MGWEERNGNRYYYQKERHSSGKVVSKYVGNGEFAHLVAQMDRSHRIERERKRQRFEAMKENLLRQRNRVREVQKAIRAVERTTLLLNGYHTHKGQWRKYRER